MANNDSNAGMIDMRTLDEPTNAFLFMAAFVAQSIKEHPALGTPVVKHRIAWLLEMGRLIPSALHDRPAVLFTLGECATDTNLRRGLIQILAELDRLAVQGAKRKA